MPGIAGRLKELMNKYVLNHDLEDTEREILATLSVGKRKEARSWRRVSNVTGDEEAARRAREAHEEAIRLTRMLEGMTDMYSYGRAGDRAGDDG